MVKRPITRPKHGQDLPARSGCQLRERRRAGSARPPVKGIGGRVGFCVPFPRGRVDCEPLVCVAFPLSATQNPVSLGTTGQPLALGRRTRLSELARRKAPQLPAEASSPSMPHSPPRVTPACSLSDGRSASQTALREGARIKAVIQMWGALALSPTSVGGGAPHISGPQMRRPDMRRGVTMTG